MHLQTSLNLTPLPLTLNTDISQRPVKDLKTLDGFLKFSISHDEMVSGWKFTDYQLGVFKEGICNTCCTCTFTVVKQQNIISQVGAYRFGVKAGFCLPCVKNCAKINPNLLHLEIGFQDSDDVHEVNLTIDRLKELKSKKNISGEEEAEITEELSGKLDSVFEICEPFLKQSELEKTKPYLCKTCNKIKAKDEQEKSGVQLANNFREQNVLAALCTACFKLCILGRGCSMVSCPKCVNKTKVCVVCMNDVVGKHDLNVCSEIATKILQKSPSSVPLELIQICECQENENDSILSI